MITFGQQRMRWQQGMTLDLLLADVDGGHNFMVVRLNGKLISRPDFAGTSVPDESVIEPLPLIAGG